MAVKAAARPGLGAGGLSLMTPIPLASGNLEIEFAEQERSVLSGVGGVCVCAS